MMTTQELKAKLTQSLFDGHYNDCICGVCNHIRSRINKEINRREKSEPSK